MHVRFTQVMALALLGAVAVAQEPAAQRGAAAATLGGKKVAVDYGRPALKGRTLADLLKQLPEERIWRAGVNQVTTLTTETDLMVGDKKLPAGKYSLYMYLPEDGSRVLLVNSDLGVPLKQIFSGASEKMANEPWPHIGDYQKAIAAKEVARVVLKKEMVKAPMDTFTVTLAPAKDSALLTLAWGEESWSLEVKPAK
jgi:hypothetical protein